MRLIDNFVKFFANLFILKNIKLNGFLIIDNYMKFGMENFKYPPWEVYTFDEFRYSGKGTRICKKSKK